MADLILNDAGTHALVRHNEHGGVWQCPLGALTTMQKLGWEPVYEAEEDDLAGLTDATTPEVQAYDPGEHTVVEVNEYLAAQAEQNPAEVQRVLIAERAGKNRQSVIDPGDLTADSPKE